MANKPQDPYWRLLKTIVAVIVVVLLVGGAFIGWLYLPYIRGNIAIAIAKGRVTPIYSQLTANTPSSVQIIEKHDVQASMYAFSLSDSADQYAHVWAELKLQSTAPAAEIIAAYSKLWSTA